MPEIAVTLNALEDPKKILYVEYLLTTGSRAKATLAAGKDYFDDFETQELIKHTRQELKDKTLITMEDHLEKLAMIRDEAMASRKYAVALSAEVARGKVGGLYVDRTQININALTNSSTEELRAQLTQLRNLLGQDVIQKIESSIENDGTPFELPAPTELTEVPFGSGEYQTETDTDTNRSLEERLFAEGGNSEETGS